MKLSIAGVGMYVSVITVLLNLFGITPDPGSVEAAVSAGVTLFGFALWIIGQVRRRDLKFGIVRKDSL